MECEEGDGIFDHDGKCRKPSSSGSTVPARIVPPSLPFRFWGTEKLDLPRWKFIYLTKFPVPFAPARNTAGSLDKKKEEEEEKEAEQFPSVIAYRANELPSQAYQLLVIAIPAGR